MISHCKDRIPIYNSNGMSYGFLDVAQLATSSPKEIITSQPTWSPGLVFHLLSRTEGPKVFYPPDLLPLVTRKAFAAKKLILSFSGRFTHWKRVNGMSWKIDTHTPWPCTHHLTQPLKIHNTWLFGRCFPDTGIDFRLVFTFNEETQPIRVRRSSPCGPWVLPIDDHLATKEPMSAVLRVSLPRWRFLKDFVPSRYTLPDTNSSSCQAPENGCLGR